jgi:hypothetical protein
MLSPNQPPNEGCPGQGGENRVYFRSNRLSSARGKQHCAGVGVARTQRTALKNRFVQH